MKILEYLTCCTCNSSSICEASSSLSADDPKCLVSVLQPERHYIGNRKTCSNKSSKSADWKPSLKAISEDDIVAVKRRNSEMTGPGRTLKQKASPMHKSKVPSRWSEEDYGRAPIPGIIPAFAPTAFLF